MTVEEPTQKKLSLFEQLDRSMHPEKYPEYQYETYFSKPWWTPAEFSALAAGMLPGECKKILDSETPPTQKIFKRVQKENEIFGKVVSLLKELSYPEMRFIDGELYLSVWRYIKLAGLYEIPLTKKFVKALPYL